MESETMYVFPYSRHISKHVNKDGDIIWRTSTYVKWHLYSPGKLLTK